MQKKFIPVKFEDRATPRALGPLFTGRFAGWLDSFVGGCSTLFGFLVIVTGVVLPGYFAFKYGYMFATTAAWFKLVGLIATVLACAFLLWVSSWATRLIASGISGLVFLGAWQYL